MNIMDSSVYNPNRQPNLASDDSQKVLLDQLSIHSDLCHFVPPKQLIPLGENKTSQGSAIQHKEGDSYILLAPDKTYQIKSFFSAVVYPSSKLDVNFLSEAQIYTGVKSEIVNDRSVYATFMGVTLIQTGDEYQKLVIINQSEEMARFTEITLIISALDN